VRCIIDPTVEAQREADLPVDIIVDVHHTLNDRKEAEICEVGRVDQVAEECIMIDRHDLLDQMQIVGMDPLMVTDAEHRRENKVIPKVRSMVLVNAKWGHRK
jgi:hypothetical protein